MSESSASEQAINGPKCIEIPRGWSRILENGAILYISPNNSRLRSLDHVIEYLKTEGTCKCGLDCPFFIHKVFNFDARIPSKLIPVNSRQEPSQSGCKHCTIDYLDAQQPSEIAVKQANDVKLPPFSTLAQKRGPGRPRNPLAKSRRVGVRKPDIDRPASPLHNIPLPVPSSIVNSPVQSVPTNIAVEQRPLPSFATIVSSSKLFNPGAGLGSTLLTNSTVTSAVSSSPLTATSSQLSKTITVTSNLAVSSSASLNSLASTVQAGTEAAKTTASVTSSPVVSLQPTAVIPATSLSKNPPGDTLTKCPSTSSVSTTSTSLTTSAPSRNNPSMETISVSSSTTSVVSTSITTVPITKQDVRSVANVSKLPSVKMSPKVTTPRHSKSAKSYGPRKTVAATLKAAAAAKVPAVSSEATRAGINSPLQRTQVVTTTVAVTSSEKGTASSASKPSSQVLPTSFVSTTVQAPALFHSVLKDPIIKEQGHAVSTPSTIATTAPGTNAVHATPIHTRGPQPVSSASARNKSAVSKEITQATTALAQSVKASLATTTTAPQHVPAHRTQVPVTGYSLANTGSGFCGQVSMPSSTSQQQIVHAASVAQSAAQIPSLASAYGQVQNSAGSSQVPSLQIAASQAQGGVFFQGNGNQVFQMNVDSSQLKGAYQLHGALYQGAIPATFIATANANKAASSNTPRGISQAMYPTNPYMLGIVMPTAITQANQSSQSVPTTATSPSATASAVATAISVASYSYNNQNAAIAAAFDSFVPIAPAASPRFSQTLAHLASAYTPFLQSGAPANAPVQFAAQRLVPMTAIQSQTGGNGQMGQTVLNLGDYAVKYPINTVKPGSYNSQPPTSSNAGPANTHPQTAVVTAMPYVTFGQINHPRFPFSVNFPTSTVSTGPSVTSSSPSPVCSFVTSASTPHQYGTSSNTDSHATNAPLGYVAMPFNSNPAGTGHSLSSPNPHPGSAFSPPSSHGSQKMDVPGPAHHLPPWVATKSLPGATNKRRCSTPDNSSSGCCNVQNACASFSVSSSRSSCMEVSASSATALRTSSSSSSQSPRHASVTSPLNSPLPMPNQGLPGCRGSPKSDSPLASNKGGVDMPSHVHLFNAVESHQVKTSSEMACALKRTYSDNNEQTKKTKYNESAYYETNPLLGLKRSCEAIEAYCSPERDDDDDDDDEDDYVDDPAVSKNEVTSPENRQSGEGIPNSKKCSNLNSRSENDDQSRGKPNSRDERPVSVENEPIGNKRQSHSLYNGDVSPNQNEPARVQMVNQSAYLPIKTNTVTPNTADNQDRLYEPPVPIARPQFDIGDIVWAQARGLPSWPGKVVDASEVGKARADDGKRWVMWFGDHTFSQVEVDRLKTLSDGLRTLDDKARKKKYKAKKARIGLEQAISEALEALEMRERLRGRQAARSKAKKKRIR